MIDIQVDTNDGEPPPLAPEIISTLVSAVLKDHRVSNGQVQIVFYSDEQLREMKKEYFNQDAFTDVIAFNLNEPDEPLDGEIYISSERALANSAKFGVTHVNELRRLVIHGSLHLLGYEDTAAEEVQIMRAKEDHFLELAGEGPSS